MAVEQILPGGLRVPDVPESPRMPTRNAAVDGLVEFARTVAGVAKTISAYEARMRDVRQEIDASGITDHEQADGLYSSRAKEVREQVRAEYADDIKDAHADFDADADGVDAAGGHAVRARAMQRSVPEQRKQLADQLKGLAQDAVDGSGVGLSDAARQRAEQRVGKFMRAGFLSKEQAVQLMQGFDQLVEIKMAEQIGANDPAAARDHLVRTKDQSRIPPSDHDALVQQYDTAARAREADKAASVKQTLSLIDKSLVDGKAPDVAALAALATLAETSGDDNLIAVADAVRDGAGFAQKLARMPLAAAVAELRTAAQEDESPARDARLAYAQGTVKLMQDRLQDDALAFAGENGVLPELPVIDLAQAAAPELAERARQARMVQEFYKLPTLQLVTRAERGALSEQFRQADPDNKQVIMSRLAGAFGAGDASRLFSSLEGVAPAEAHLAALGVSGQGREDVARRGFRGAQALAQKGVSMPDDGEFAGIENELLWTLFDARHGEARSGVIAAARALYAERSITRGTLGFDAEGYRQDLHAALGRGPKGGGMAMRHGAKVLLPLDMTETDFNAQIDNLSDQAMAKASLGGAPVHVSLDGKAVKASLADVKNAYPVQSGYGRWKFSVTNPQKGAPQFLLDDKTGGYFTLDLSDSSRRSAIPVATVPDLTQAVDPLTGVVLQ